MSEAQDFACDLLDADGESLAHSPRAMPVFNLTLPRAVKALLQKFPPETLQPGDVLVTNDPWLCAGHLFDIAVVTPVFRNGTLVALTGTVGHVGDIGGTKDSLRAREIYEEGIQIPPMMLYRAGVPNDDLFTLIAENVRKSEEVLGDIHSFVAANALGAERLLAFMDEYGMHDLRALAHVVQNRAEAGDARRDPRPAGWRLSLGDLEQPAGREAALSAEDSRCRATRSNWISPARPPQLPQGGLNCTFSYTAAHATYPMKCMLSPQVRSNAGCYRPFTVKAPAGSILNCDKPASVNLRTRVGWYLAPNIFRALADAAPTQVQAATGLPRRDQHLRPRGRRPRLRRPLLHGRRPGRLAAQRRQVGAAVSDLRRQYLGGADGSARAGAGAGEILRHRFRRRRRASRRLRRAHAAAQAAR